MTILYEISNYLLLHFNVLSILNDPQFYKPHTSLVNFFLVFFAMSSFYLSCYLVVLEEVDSIIKRGNGDCLCFISIKAGNHKIDLTL